MDHLIPVILVTKMPSEAGATPASACPQARQNDCWARRAHRTPGTPPPEHAFHAKNGPWREGGAAPLRVTTTQL
jgi:hypothetical protein